jgi:DNA-directed RNA polymerase subunit RPC12/RpoP
MLRLRFEPPSTARDRWVRWSRPTGPYPLTGYVRADAETHIVIPPLVRRCTECGHVTWGHRFATATTDDGTEAVECPSCGHRFQPVDSPLLK